MKLLNYTTRYLALVLLFLISIWAVALYYAMLDEIYDSLDDGLENQKILVLRRIEKDKKLLANTNFEHGNYAIKKISKNSYKEFEESYSDTLMYMHNEDDFEPVRTYSSGIKHNGAHYQLKVITSMVEEDDLIEDLVSYLIALYLLLLITVVLLNNVVLKKIWKPFYGLLGRLHNFRIEQDEPIMAQKSKIDEFNLLNESVERLTQKSKETYTAQKQFIENASHELQTPLAISINKLELFVEKNDLAEAQLLDIAVVLDNLGRLTRMNKALLLLSKIENSQYGEEEDVDFSQLIQNSIAEFADFAAHREIDFEFKEGALNYFMNRDLATILVTNLIKNAIVHGREGATILIEIANNEFVVKNQGAEKALDPVTVFSRFKSAGGIKKSTGLGLAISRAITVKYGLKLTYSHTKTHDFSVKFPSK